MWFTFAAAVLVAAVFLYAPGFLFFRAFGLSRFASFAVAPGFSVFAVVVAGLALAAAGVACPAWALGVIAACVGLVAFGIGCLVRSCGCGSADGKRVSASRIGENPDREAGLREGEGAAGRSRGNSFGRSAKPAPLARLGLLAQWGGNPWKALGLFVGVSALVTLVVFVHPLGDPYAFARLDDSAAHLALVRSFLDSGFYSTLSASGYADMGEAGGYYPAAWHICTAVVASLFGNSVALGTNAMTFAVCAIVFPSGLCFLFSQVFSGAKHAAVVACGAVVAVAFAGYPWGFLTWGQLLSNLLSYALVPGALGLFACAVRPGRRRRIGFVVAFVITAAAIVLAQPNGIFVLGIWVVAYAVSRVLASVEGGTFEFSRKRVLAACAIFLVACVAWVAFFFAPPLQVVVQYSWSPFLSPVQALIAGGSFMFSGRTGVQPFLTVLVLAGIVYACRNRRFLWLAVAFVFAWALWFLDAVCEGPVKQFLTGFWYTDYNRTGAMAALFAIPLAAMGFAWLLQLVSALFGRLGGGRLGARKACACSLCVLLVVMAAVQFAPLHAKVGDSDIRAGLMAVHKQFKTRYSWDRIYTAEEQAFVHKVQASIPAEAVVLNVPHDGSAYSYAIDGIRTFYRRCSPSAFAGNKETGKLLRTSLNKVASSEEVQRAVRDSGAQYVLLLDAGKGEDATVSSLRYKKEDWVGIESITEETQGFTLVMSEGDMRLYRIDMAAG